MVNISTLFSSKRGSMVWPRMHWVCLAYRARGLIEEISRFLNGGETWIFLYLFLWEEVMPSPLPTLWMHSVICFLKPQGRPFQSPKTNWIYFWF